MLPPDGMLIRRCAWHRVYNGYPMVYGVAGWRKRGVQYTDGMCRRCAATALQEWTRGSEKTPRPRQAVVRLRSPAGRAGIAVAAASILVALGLTVVARRDGDREAAISALPRAVRGAGPETPHDMCVDPALPAGAPAASAPRTP